jgi:cytochrome b6-f complex iron-sulfur subunit
MSKTTRRTAMHRLGWGMVATSAGASCVGSTALLFPRVRHRLPSVVILGPPDQFRVGEVAEVQSQRHRLAVIREPERIYALSSECTHLGCIIRWQGSQNQFKCFCHGSSFTRAGDNVEGPAPRPLERLKVELDAQGRLVVDTAVHYRSERGEWDDPGAWLAYAPGAAGKEGGGNHGAP